MDMEKFKWQEKYSVGIKKIDEQHKKFFSITNSIIDLLGSGNSVNKKLNPALMELEDYANYHLGTEESYFDKFTYKDADFHIAQHDQYRDKIAYYRKLLADKRGDDDCCDLAEEIVNYSIHWLSDHILTVDILYTEFLKEHGVE